jgi:hypothetical protein
MFVGAAAMLVSSLAIAGEQANGQGRVSLLVGAGAGLSGIGDLPAALLLAHVGAGWRRSGWLAGVVAAYSSAEHEAALGDWAVVRRQLVAGPLVLVTPVPGSRVHVHAHAGLGPSTDRLRGFTPEVSSTRLSAAIAVGGGWGPVSLTGRYVVPEARICQDNCYRAGGHLQVALSLTLNLLALAGD